MPSSKAAKVLPENLIAANLLESWANEFRVAQDSYVQGVISALREKKNLLAWSSLSPLEYLPHPNIERSSKLKLIISIISLVRNALVFTPVALTWYAINRASTAFSAYTAQNSLNVINFLDFWENGYGVLSKNWSLSNVAIADVQIVATIILSTIIISTLEIRTKRIDAQELQDIEEKRFEVALTISMQLNEYTKLTPLSFNQESSRIIKNLSASTRELKESTKLITKLISTINTRKPQ